MRRRPNARAAAAPKGCMAADASRRAPRRCTNNKWVPGEAACSVAEENYEEEVTVAWNNDAVVPQIGVGAHHPNSRDVWRVALGLGPLELELSLST
eukprot:SAG11_NODE_95_length_17051_cov_3.557102_11_plen_96_part_00